MADERKANKNLIPQAHRLTVEEQSAGGKASAASRKAKKTFKESLRYMMEEEAPEKIQKAFSRNGYDISTHREAITAAILMGAMKGEPKMVDKALELLGEDYKKQMREEEVKLQKERLAMEKERAELERLKAEAYIEAVKSQQDAEMEDDGFLEALKSSAKDDWDD